MSIIKKKRRSCLICVIFGFDYIEFLKQIDWQIEIQSNKQIKAYCFLLTKWIQIRSNVFAVIY